MKKSILFLMAIVAIVALIESCSPDETTTSITYTNDVEPIMGNCTGCHGGTSPSGDLLLTNYAEVRAAGESDSLIVRMNDVMRPMPPTGLLPEGDRETIQEWIDGGYIE